MKEVRIDRDPVDLAPGLVGLVQAVAALMRADPTELLGISSAAFCNYVFDPEINRHEADRREFSPLAALFSNYGPWESIGYYTGWEVREVNALGDVDTLKVVVFEIDQRRPVVTLTPMLEPALVTGYRISVDERVVLSTRGELVVRGEQRLQAGHEIFRNWMLLVRPSEQPAWAATQARQRLDVLRWAAEHGQGPKEFFQETRENYASGLAALDRFRGMLEGLSDPATITYAEQYMRSLQAARDAAATCLERWASSVAAEASAPEVEPLLLEASRAYREVARALDAGPNFVDALTSAAPHETAAHEALAAAARSFPAAFEGS